MACRPPRESRPSPPVYGQMHRSGQHRHGPALCSSMYPNRPTGPAGSAPLPRQPPCIIPLLNYKFSKDHKLPPTALYSHPYRYKIRRRSPVISSATEMEGRNDLDFENLEATELRLGLPGIDWTAAVSKANKRALGDDCDLKRSPPKAQVVGWPPVRSSYRKNSFQAKRLETVDAAGAGIFVKVSMDGAPYLRKIDLKIYKGYKELREALEDMFKGFSLSLDVEACNESEDAIAYEDKDGDWMLAGDVPWEMFISSCRRLRIMKGSEARGLASSP